MSPSTEVRKKKEAGTLNKKFSHTQTHTLVRTYTLSRLTVILQNFYNLTLSILNHSTDPVLLRLDSMTQYVFLISNLKVAFTIILKSKSFVSCTMFFILLWLYIMLCLGIIKYFLQIMSILSVWLIYSASICSHNINPVFGISCH